MMQERKEYSQQIWAVRLQETSDTEIREENDTDGEPGCGACVRSAALLVDVGVDLHRNLPFHAARTASKRLPLREDSSLNSSYAFWGSSRMSRGMVMASSSSKTVRRSPELMRAHGASDTRKVRPASPDGIKVYTSRKASHWSCGRVAIR